MLAQLFSDDRAPPAGFWSQDFVASRLLEFEVLSSVHARGAAATHGADAHRLVDRVTLLEISERVLGRALLPFAQPVRTLDALHLATLDFLRGGGLALALATFDRQLAAAAGGLGFARADCRCFTR